jgi:hypothetical protein
MEKETINTTTNSRVYKLLLKHKLLNYYGLCPICPPHGGCNFRKQKIIRNWKQFRKNKWKGPS